MAPVKNVLLGSAATILGLTILSESACFALAGGEDIGYISFKSNSGVHMSMALDKYRKTLNRVGAAAEEYALKEDKQPYEFSKGGFREEFSASGYAHLQYAPRFYVNVGQLMFAPHFRCDGRMTAGRLEAGLLELSEMASLKVSGALVAGM